MSQHKRIHSKHTRDPQPLLPSTGVESQTSPLPLPLSALLSQAFVAFTIECDNEFEHRMHHRTTNHDSTSESSHGPWLVSMAMWATCMQFVPEEGITVTALSNLARTETNLAGMKRWGYITIQPDQTDSRSKQPKPDAVIRPTRVGRKVQEIWPPLPGIIEQRWQERFGKDNIAQLREALQSLTDQFEIELPDYLPILRHGLFSGGKQPGVERSFKPETDHKQPAATSNTSDLPLSALLARVLLAFALGFERKSSIALAIGANVLRILNEQGVHMRDLPQLSGVSKEAISMAMGVLQEMSLAVVEPDPAGSRFKIVRLTPEGLQAQNTYHRLLIAVEERWQERFGQETIHRLRTSLEPLVGKPGIQLSPLLRGLEPYPDGWRAAVRKPTTLPHYPMVLHRGGYPDGS